jgi:hypothetical protein
LEIVTSHSSPRIIVSLDIPVYLDIASNWPYAIGDFSIYKEVFKKSGFSKIFETDGFYIISYIALGSAPLPPIPPII